MKKSKLYHSSITEKTGLYRSSIYPLIKKNKYPAQIAIDSQAADWDYSETYHGIGDKVNSDISERRDRYSSGTYLGWGVL